MKKKSISLINTGLFTLSVASWVSFGSLQKLFSYKDELILWKREVDPEDGTESSDGSAALESHPLS